MEHAISIEPRHASPLRAIATHRPVNISTGRDKNPGKDSLDLGAESAKGAEPKGSEVSSGSIKRVTNIFNNPTAAENQPWWELIKIAAGEEKEVKGEKLHNAHQVPNNWGGSGKEDNVVNWEEEFEHGPWLVEEGILADKRVEVSKNNTIKPEKGPPQGIPWKERHRLRQEYEVHFMTAEDVNAILPSLNTKINKEEQEQIYNLFSWLPKTNQWQLSQASPENPEGWNIEYSKSFTHKLGMLK